MPSLLNLVTFCVVTCMVNDVVLRFILPKIKRKSLKIQSWIVKVLIVCPKTYFNVRLKVHLC